jgi:hypothetical protein
MCPAAVFSRSAVGGAAGAGQSQPTEDHTAPPTTMATMAAFRKLPLTDAEFQIIATNVPPYLR